MYYLVYITLNRIIFKIYRKLIKKDILNYYSIKNIKKSIIFINKDIIKLKISVRD